MLATDAGWEAVPLIEVLEFREGPGILARDFRKSGVPLIRLAGLRKRGALLAGCNYLDPDMVSKRWEHFRLKEGDVLLSTSASLGEVAVVDSTGVGAIGYTGIIGFRPKNARMLPEFIPHALTAPSFARQIEAMGAGSVLRHFGPLHLRQMTLQVPPIDVQRAIAAVLGALDDKIESNDRIRQGGDQLLKTRFRQIAAPAVVHVAEDGPLPSGWRHERLDSVLSVLETGSRPRGGVAGYATGVPSLGAESIVGIARYDYAKTKYVPTEYFSAMKRGVIEDCDVLLYKDGGRPGEFEPHVSLLGNGFPFTRLCINEHVYRLRAAEPVSQEFLYYWLESEPILEEMRRRGTGVAIPGLNSSAVRDLPIELPPVSMIEEFTSVASPVVALALSLGRESRALSVLRDSLLPKLLSGELRVRDAEPLVEDVV